MRLLLDTHVLLWWLADDPSLGAEARTAIAAGESTVFVSAASAWEISIKQAAGKLEAPSDLERQVELNRFEPLRSRLATRTPRAPWPLIMTIPWTACSWPRPWPSSSPS